MFYIFSIASRQHNTTLKFQLNSRVLYKIAGIFTMIKCIAYAQYNSKETSYPN